MTSDEQLDLWCAGTSVHNPDRGECCPDFSCCNPYVQTPLEVRARFRDADAHAWEQMLMMFLGEALARYYDHEACDKDGELPPAIYLAGDATHGEVPS